ncbi:MAG TPA: hypothetical protein VF017_18140 [Thermoanaerobaculia bacterium]|nr:hypothetical protein [Thermoanaerobaculia bacterium]
MAKQHPLGVLTLCLALAPRLLLAQCPSPERSVAVPLGAQSVDLPRTTIGGTNAFLRFEVIAPPRHGSLIDDGEILKYFPGLDFWTVGADSFQIEVVTGDQFERAVSTRHLVQLIATGSREEVMSWDVETADPPDDWRLGDNLQRLADASWSGAHLLRPTMPPIAHSEGHLLALPRGNHGGGSQGSGGSSGWRPPGGGGGGGLIGAECDGPVLLAQTHPSSGALLQVHAQSDGTSGYLCLAAPGLGLTTPWRAMAPGPHHVELLHWQDSAAGLPHGAGLWVDGELHTTLDLSAAVGLSPSAHHAFAPFDPASGNLVGDLDELSVFQIGDGPRSFCRGADTFELGEISAAWQANVPMNVTVGPAAALEGAQGAAIQVGVAPTPGALLSLALPSVPRRLGARFRFDPNGADLAPGSRVVLLTTPTAAGSRAFRVFLDAPAAGGYALVGDARRDNGTVPSTVVIPITDDAHTVEVDWQRSLSDPAGTGFYRLWVDGQLAARLEGLTNDGQEVTEVKIGAVLAVGAASGAVLVDSLEVWEQK